MSARYHPQANDWQVRVEVARMTQRLIRYLSFQRSPPSHLVPGQSVVLAPTITNDLRDEVYSPEDDEEIVKMHLAWILQDQVDVKLIKREDSIEWQGPQTAWKNVTISAPTEKQLGGVGILPDSSSEGPKASLRLAMWVSDEATEGRPTKKSRLEIDSGRQSLLSHLAIDPASVIRQSAEKKPLFLPVLTPGFHLIPNEVASSSTATEAKMSRIARWWLLPKETSDASSSSSSSLRRWVEIEEEIGYELDRHVWDAAIPMIALLGDPASSRNPLRGDLARSDEADEGQDWVVLELGAGTGLVSLYLSYVWSSRPIANRTRVRIIATDLPDSIAFIDDNIRVNESHRASSESTHTFVTAALDWYAAALPAEIQHALAASAGETTSPKSKSNSKSTPEPNLLVLASDCSYNPDTYPCFAQLLRRLLDYDDGGDEKQTTTRCLISKKHRHADEVALWQTLEEHSLEARLVAGKSDDDKNEMVVQMRESRHRNAESGTDENEDMDSIGQWGIFEICKSKS